jgi:predicted phosphodiesterase
MKTNDLTNPDQAGNPPSDPFGEAHTRRTFLRRAGFLGMAGITGLGAGQAQKAIPSAGRTFRPVKFGILADIHRDLTPDADERLEVFLKRVESEKPDFIISLGDFAHPLPANRPFAERFRQAACPAWHVLGNHENDRGTKAEAAAFLEMPAPYYSFDMAGYHCVVLDGNFIYDDNAFIDYEKGNYFRVNGRQASYISDEQCEWLAADLQSTALPTLIFSHQSLLHDLDGIPNRAFVQRLLETANEQAGFHKVVACFNGHHHQDFYRCINRIHYFSINSASYFWHDRSIPGRYAPELEEKYGNLHHMALYRDTLSAFVSIDPHGHLSLRGVMSQWAVPAPENSPSASVRFGREALPSILDRQCEL